MRRCPSRIAACSAAACVACACLLAPLCRTRPLPVPWPHIACVGSNMCRWVSSSEGFAIFVGNDGKRIFFKTLEGTNIVALIGTNAHKIAKQYMEDNGKTKEARTATSPSKSRAADLSEASSAHDAKPGADTDVSSTPSSSASAGARPSASLAGAGTRGTSTSKASSSYAGHAVGSARVEANSNSSTAPAGASAATSEVRASFFAVCRHPFLSGCAVFLLEALCVPAM